MSNGKATTRLAALALAVATVACAPQRVGAQDAPPATPPSPPAAPQPVPAQTSPAAEPRSKDPAHAAAERADLNARFEDLNVRLQAARQKGGQFATLSRTVATHQRIETSALIVTQPLDEPTSEALKEDLGVMDKLLRDVIDRSGLDGDDNPEVLGIKLKFVTRPTFMAPPTYIEGTGAVFSASVNWPLAASPNGAPRAAGKQRDRISAWETARRELKGAPKDPNMVDVDVPAFEEERLNRLVSSIVKVLPEAKNFRHLKENESVFVTVSGADESGSPRRLTLKASKADIDAAAGGTIDAEALRQRVAVNVGQ